ncbi:MULTISPECIES: DMT family transporter [Clostridium]|uniref:DMT family transporter n=1 Tax=Clostridium TaxID=1485 RepID=UPI00069EDED6|nr:MULTISPECIES: DMT family transporter [Clostridium]KOF57740.1 transporter [Clostridium sp. DMHC 10]MCD2345744.1 DMT family transporter [Clostridium guangxiense]
MDIKVKIPLENRTKGIVFVIFAATLWGVSGTFAQYLFHNANISADWLVDIRLLFSGIGLIGIAVIKKDKNIFKLCKSKYDLLSLVIFSIIGMLGVQYSYFTTIKYSNAPTSTILQYLSLVFIILHSIIKYKRIPHIKEILAVILALMGTFLLATNGNIHKLAISSHALFWGIIAAFTAAFYTIYPRRILIKFGSNTIVGFGMLIGGILFSFVASPFKIHGSISTYSMLAIIFVVLFGTLIPFYFYFESVTYIKPSETGILSCMEPLSAVILSIFWLNTKFSIVEFVGMISVLSTILILSTNEK